MTQTEVLKKTSDSIRSAHVGVGVGAGVYIGGSSVNSARVKSTPACLVSEGAVRYGRPAHPTLRPCAHTTTVSVTQTISLTIQHNTENKHKQHNTTHTTNKMHRAKPRHA